LGTGESIEFAHKLGCSAIQMAGIQDAHLIPKLIQKNSIPNHHNNGNNTVVEPAHKQWQLTEAQKDQLIDCLLACNSLKKHDTRETIFQILPYYDAIEAHNNS
jgi:hypothetical protein